MNQLSIEVTGSRQSIWWNNETPYQLFKGQKGKGTTILNQPFSGGFKETFKALFEQFYKAIAFPKSAITYPTLMDGYKNVSVCEAIYQSAKNDSIWTTCEQLIE